jgi:signal peptide peptidase SppA
VYGVEELSDKIFAARDRKPIYSIADSMACSAAYWLATSAQTVCCTPGGDVGSVGVYCLHIDESEMLKGLGVKVSWIHAGKYKVEGNSAEPLDDEARANLQASVDETYGKFIDALSRNRHDVSKADVRANFGQGRVMSAAKALGAKMIDRIDTFENLMAKLTGSGGQGSASRAASVEMQRMRHAARERGMAFSGK